MFYNRLINRYGRLDAQSLPINPPELLGSSLRSVHYQSERIGGSQLFRCRWKASKPTLTRPTLLRERLWNVAENKWITLAVAANANPAASCRG